MKALGKTVGMAFFLFGLGCCIAHVAGCKPELPPVAIEDTAKGTYLAEHMWCINKFHTDPEIDACREAVRHRWKVEEPVSDAGGDR